MYHSPSSPSIPINQPKTILIREFHYVFYHSIYSWAENGYRTAAEYMSVHRGWNHQSLRKGIWLGSLRTTLFRGLCTVSDCAVSLGPSRVQSYGHPSSAGSQHAEFVTLRETTRASCFCLTLRYKYWSKSRKEQQIYQTNTKNVDYQLCFAMQLGTMV